MGKRRKRLALGRVRVTSVDNVPEALAIIEGENFQ
jgi:hypothetical protein